MRLFTLNKAAFIAAFTAISLSSAASSYEFKDDRDGQKYPVVIVGETSIFAKNLNYKSKGSFCYDDDPTNCRSFGRLYTWNDAIDACPTGWEIISEEDVKNLEKNKKAYSQFRLTTGGFRNSKGKYELIDKRFDMWLADGVDMKNSKYWFYSASKNNTNISQYSKTGAMSVRCVNYFSPDECNYNCTCDQGQDYPEAKEFENDKVLVCTYTFESRSGTMNPSCPRDFTHYSRFWKKESPESIAECPEPYGEEYESLSDSELFVGANDKTSFVIHENKVCIISGEKPEVEYKKCVPLSKASSMLTPQAKQLFGL